MKYLKIKNTGELDIRLVALMGGTTKANNEFKIGQFGTGLKYTLAYLVRNNVDFHIFSGGKKIEIAVETETIQDTEFSIICINGNRTSITDKMGLEWNAWMIIRELWCNALDEGGQERDVTETIEGEDGTTTFYIQLTQEVKAVVDNWSNYFVHDVKPIFSDANHAIYDGGDDLRLYKNGVLIKEIKNTKSVFSYDMKYASINEMREYNGSASQILFNCLKDANEQAISHFLETVTENHYEGKDMDWNWYSNLSDTWKKVIGNGKIIHKKSLEALKAKGIEVDTTSMVVVPEIIYTALTKQFKGIGALRIADKVNEFYETYSSDSDEKIKQALVILEEAGYYFSPQIKFVFGVFGDKTVWAKINIDDAECLISENINDKSLFDVCTTLIEENEHFKTGFTDCTRSFQQHFIDLYANQLFKTAKISL